MKMKKMTILLLTVLLFCSCSKDEKDSTYELTYNMGVLWNTGEVILFEYNDAGDKIHNNPITIKERGEKHMFTAMNSATKVKVYVDGDWVQQVFILNKGQGTKIVINGETMIGRIEP